MTIGVFLMALACSGVTPAQDIVVDSGGSLLVSVRGAIVRVHPQTGALNVVSSDEVGSGPSISGGGAGRMTLDGVDVVVSDNLPGMSFQLVRVDPISGDRTIVSDPGAGTGPLLEFPRDISAAPDGSMYVAEGHPMLGVAPAIFRVNGVTGDRTIVSDNSTGAGRDLVEPAGLVVDADGELVVADWQPRVSEGAFFLRRRDPTSIVRVYPSSGDRVAISRGRRGGLRRVPDLAFVTNGNLVVAEWGQVKFCVSWCPECRLCTFEDSALKRVDMASGGSRLLSGGGTCLMQGDTCLTPLRDEAGTGPRLGYPAGLALETPSSFVLVTQDHSVLRVDGTTGDRTLVAQGVDTLSPEAGPPPAAAEASAGRYAFADVEDQRVYRPRNPRAWLRKALGEAYAPFARRPLARIFEGLSAAERQSLGTRLYPAVWRAMRDVLGATHPDTLEAAAGAAASAAETNQPGLRR